jgi:HdeA/HdeB family protein
MLKLMCAAAALGSAAILTIDGADAADPKKPSQWTCQDFLEVDDDVKPKVVYWMEGFNKAGKPEVAAVGVDYFDRPVTTVVTECQKEPKANLWDKIKAYFSNL